MNTRSVLCALASLAAPLAAADARSLFANGDFEVLVGAAPASWPLPDGASLVAEKGNHFLRLTAGGAGKSVTVYRQEPVDQAKALHISWRARWAEVKRGAQPWHDARIIFDFKDADGKVVGPGPGHPFYTGSGGWETKSLDIAVPSGAVFITVMPAIFEAESGTFDIDDLVVVPIKPEELGKPAPGAKR